MNKKNNFSIKLTNFFKNISLKRNDLFMLHVKLKNIKKNTHLEYFDVAEIIINSLEKIEPKNILVPAFTYSFTEGKSFDIEKSKSEAGLFSEIFRKNYSSYRTADPIFSICHTRDFNDLYLKKKINFLKAFNNESIWEFLYKSDITVINIGLDHLIISLIHYIEFLCNVPYRQNIIKRGEVFEKDICKMTSYVFYARKLHLQLGLDWNKIEKVLISQNAILVGNIENTKITLCKIKTVADVLIPLVEKDPFFLVKNT